MLLTLLLSLFPPSHKSVLPKVPRKTEAFRAIPSRMFQVTFLPASLALPHEH